MNTTIATTTAATTIDENYEFRALTDLQKKLLAILPIPSSLLSIFGSSIIIVTVWKVRKQKAWIPYQRLLLAMSVCDIVSSLTLAVGAFLYPQETSDKVWVIGNDASCSAIGFLNQISYSGTLYNGFLSFYFLFTARFGMKNRQIEKRIEPAMHLFAIGFPIITALVGLVMDFYAEPEVGIGCWVNRWPKQCGEGPDGTGEECQSPMIAWVFGAWIALFVLGALIVNNAVIWVFVHQRTRGNVHHHHHHQGAIRKVPSQKLDRHDETSDSNSHHSDDEETRTSGRNSQMGLLSMASSFRTLNSTGRGSAGNLSVSTAAQQREIQATQSKRLKLVGSQAFLFVGCYFVSNIWTYVLRLYESRTTDYIEEKELPYSYYSILVTQAVLLPLQGLFNMMVFIRPKYLRLRSENPSESKWAIVHRVIFGEAARSGNNSADFAERFTGQRLDVNVNKAPLANKGVSSLTITSEVVPQQATTENNATEANVVSGTTNKPVRSVGYGLDAILETSERGESSSLKASMRSETSPRSNKVPRILTTTTRTGTGTGIGIEHKQQRHQPSLTAKATTMQEEAQSRSSESSIFMQGTGWSDSLDSMPSSRSLKVEPIIPEGSVPNISSAAATMHTSWSDSLGSMPSSRSLTTGASNRSISDGSIPNIAAARMHTGWSSSSDGNKGMASIQGTGSKIEISGELESPTTNRSPRVSASSYPSFLHTGWSSSVESMPVSEDGGRVNTRTSMNVDAKRKQLVEMQFVDESDASSTDSKDDNDRPHSSSLDLQDSKQIDHDHAPSDATAATAAAGSKTCGDAEGKAAAIQEEDVRMSFLMPTGWSLDNMPLCTEEEEETTNKPRSSRETPTGTEQPSVTAILMDGSFRSL
ncbi:unnamed protein product [Cylindrotheca closterium]|uniref:G-protein coupled receptors family 1 profile domain-containing protein n=1 Tax=Cylindrotheca closterium TaxID=2856 RepID=A0AAD2CZY4_9STRA|nr:unnamed protein product [Cylindrotheca closterium]